MLALLDDVTRAMGLLAPLAGIALALTLPWLKKPVSLLPSASPRRLIVLALLAIASLVFATGAGSCVLGGFLQGAGFCSITRRRVTWDPVADFYVIQAVWSVGFLIAAFMAAIALLSLLPGRTSGWQRFRFLVSAGRRGAWRDARPAPDPVAERALEELRKRIAHETDPARKANWIAAEATVRNLREAEARIAQALREARELAAELGRASRFFAWVGLVSSPLLSLLFLAPVITGVLTHETYWIGRRPVTAALGAEPVMFWITMGASLAMSVAIGYAGVVCARLLARSRTIAGE